MEYLCTAVSIGLGLMFLSTAVPKLRNPRGFVLVVLNYDVLPAPMAILYARLLPYAELVVGVLLLSGTIVRAAGMVAALLLFGFVVGISLNIARGREIDCGCATGRGSSRVGSGILVRDLLLLCAAIAVVVATPSWMYWFTWMWWHGEAAAVDGLSRIAIVTTAVLAVSLRGGSLRGTVALRLRARQALSPRALPGGAAHIGDRDS
jgi:hypothetical protein